MKAYDYILSKQVNWALNRGIKLIGSENERGRPAYTSTLEDNLFEPLKPEVRKSFESGEGAEIEESKNKPAKIWKEQLQISVPPV